MKTKNLDIKRDGEFLIINGVLHFIMSQHSFDDLGQTLDTFHVMNYQGDTKTIYSLDEGKTFVDEIE